MSQNPPAFTLPEFFQADTASSSTVIRCEPDELIDLFYARPDQSSAATLIAIASCPDGRLAVLPEADFRTLPRNMSARVNDVLVSHRGDLRLITASEFTLFALYGIERPVRTRGFNDAQYLHLRLDAQVVWEGSTLQIADLMRTGWLPVSQLDLLYACLSSLDTAFEPPHGDGSTIYTLVVPTASRSVLMSGRGLGLAYPMTDVKGLRAIGNEPILMRLFYDVLTHLQQDVRDERPEHPFAEFIVPVPNRRRIEDELRDDGYDIYRDEAVRYRSPKSPRQPTMLDYLRRLLPIEWVGDRILIPPQAVLSDYKALSNGALSEFVGKADEEIFAQMAEWIIPGYSPISRPAKSSPVTPPSTQQAIPNNPPRPRSVDAPSLAPLIPASESVPSAKSQARRWEDDFAASIHKPINTPNVEQKTQWTADFDSDAQLSSLNFTTQPHAILPDELKPDVPTNGMNREDWLADFETRNTQ